MVFGVACVFGGRPSAPTFTVSMPTETYPAGTGRWVPSSDPSGPLVYQGAATVPNPCGGRQLRLEPLAAEPGV